MGHRNRLEVVEFGQEGLGVKKIKGDVGVRFVRDNKRVYVNERGGMTAAGIKLNYC